MHTTEVIRVLLSPFFFPRLARGEGSSRTQIWVELVVARRVISHWPE